MSNSEHIQTITQLSILDLNFSSQEIHPEESLPKETLSKNPLKILDEYLNTLTKKHLINETKNAVTRYFVPSVGGPVITAAPRRAANKQETEAALNFLEEHVTLEQLADSPNLISEIFNQRDTSPGQQERVRSNLRALIDWAREQQYLSAPHNPIPDNLCDSIQIGQFDGCPLKPATARQICEQFLRTLDRRTDQTDLINAIIRYFVPGCNGPLPHHKPALDSEIEAGLQFLESVPLEYLSESPTIATDVLNIYGLTNDHGTRVRSSLRALLDWAREQRYLPDPDRVAPWGGEHISPRIIHDLEAVEAVVSEKTVVQSYEQYCQYLEQSNQVSQVKPLQTVVVRYLVPACGGPRPSGKKATQTEVQSSLAYLPSISLTQFDDLISLVDVEFEAANLSLKQQRPIRSRLNAWCRWHNKQGYSKREVEPEPEFNTFRSSAKQSEHGPGYAIYEKQVAAHALCAKRFTNDYINVYLKQQIEDYKQYRLRSDINRTGIALGTLKTELEFIHQLMGWLHRYEGIPLDQLRFESLISVNNLIFRIGNRSYDDYLRGKEKGTQEASDKAYEDCLRVQRYLEFTGGKPKSQRRRLSNVIAIAKFLYQDVIGTDDFPEERFIPVIRRLLKYQRELKAITNPDQSTVDFRETSVEWSRAIEVMLKQRRRADQTIRYQRNPGYRCGYQKIYLTKRSIAHELQRFLSIAFCIVIPSRSRTFYDLRIGETFKEGILTEKGFLSVSQLKELKLRDEYQDKVRFYFHHLPEDYKTGRSMTQAMLDNDGWWAEVRNLEFGQTTLYDYIRRWLEWGRTLAGPVSDNYFFRRYTNNQPLDGGAWNARIKTIFKFWIGVRVPPKNIRKMFAIEFPDYVESASILLQHSEKIHREVYDMRLSIKQMQPVVDANADLIQSVFQNLANEECEER